LRYAPIDEDELRELLKLKGRQRMSSVNTDNNTKGSNSHRRHTQRLVIFDSFIIFFPKLIGKKTLLFVIIKAMITH
jgi:hypothetical protein